MQRIWKDRRLRAALTIGLAVAVLAVAILGTAAVTGGIAARSARATALAQAQATATQIIPTATPNLVVHSPRVLATFMTVNIPGPTCEQCQSLTFTAYGPFYLIASCNPFEDFGGAAPSYQLQLFNTTGHLLDTLQESCGDPNQDVPTTTVVPESLAAGNYQLQMGASFPPVTVIILDAAG